MAYLAARDSKSHTAQSPSNSRGRPGLRQHQKTLTALETEQVIAKYRRGTSIVGLATQDGCHRTTVSKKLIDAGIEIREKAPTDHQIMSVVQLNASGLSLARVGERIGCSLNTVLKYLEEQGTEIWRRPGRKAAPRESRQTRTRGT